MRRLAALMLTAVFLPITLVTATAAPAGAVNANPWKSTNVNISQGLVGDTLRMDIDCQVTARYLTDGLGMQWANSTCVNGFDGGIPGVTTEPPEPGSTGTLTFKGARAGSTGGDVWTGTANCGATTSTQAYWVKCTPDATLPTGGSAGLYLDLPATYPGTTGTSLACARKVGTSTYAFTSRYNSGALTPPIPAGHTYHVFTRPATGVVDEWEIDMQPAVGFACNSTAFVKEFVVRVAAASPGYTVPTSAAPVGSGSGTPCSAAYVFTMGANDDDSFSQRTGTLLSGAQAFPVSGSGLCIVTQVCIQFTDREEVGCSNVDFGTPLLTGTDIPDTDAPPAFDPAVETPEDEPSFWQQILGALRTLFKIMAKGFGLVVEAVEAVVDALADLASAIVDGIAGLFIPSDGLFEDAQDTVGDSWSGGNAGEWTDTMSSVADDPGSASSAFAVAGFSSGGGGCGGPSVNWDGFDGTGVGTIHPLSACGDLTSQMATWSRIILGAFISVAAIFKIVQILMVALGATKAGQEVTA